MAEHFYNREMEAYNAYEKEVERDENGYIVPIVFYSDEEVTEDEESSEDDNEDIDEEEDE